ncbi:MAG TPA: indolepyruvate ferredoxin oxidoreductase family protein [Candidatus Binataceae bacterium]|nr:indolepyruvate ferredoxin oxidoreductase family protein [Candidatus Binataceae bacterium]
MASNSDFSLDGKYRLEQGTIFLSGIQALVRLPIDQHRADRRRGLNTATLICGYRGSPLGGYDTALERERDLLHENNVVFLSGVNEDIAATAIYGTQFAHAFPKPKYDGVLGLWYGKGPGVDRTGDAFRHANFAGIGEHGGVLALAGDDPFCKSSTLPTHSETALYDASMPVLSPGNVQEILDLGRLGFELSRYSGLWVGFKIVANIADEISTAEVSPDRTQIIDPQFTHQGNPWRPMHSNRLLAPLTLDLERDIFYGRMDAARAFAAVHPLNSISGARGSAWLGIAAPGKTYYDVREALATLGLDDSALQRYGIRLLRIGMLSPMEPSILRQFAEGLEELLVIEEKRPFVELFIRDILYNQAVRPRIAGKRDELGNYLIPADRELDADRLVPILAARLRARIPMPDIAPPPTPGASNGAIQVPSVVRQAYFCSGCPHNRSTTVPEGSLAGGGIGCHALALSFRPETVGLTHMGGEGAQWIGMSLFTDVPHLFQNVGDGTLFHSASMVVRQAVAAGTNVTFKILYNSAVAMTGGQDAAGALTVPDLTRLLEAEGVRSIMVLSEQPEVYPGEARWAKDVRIWHRDRLGEAQRLLRDTRGVTALIYDQRCAAEKRRLRKRGRLAEPLRQVFINEAVCEGCGDCGVKSNCLSVHPVETEFGRKTQIHQSSCNRDYTCLQGDCPSFVTITATEPPARKSATRFRVERELPPPQSAVPSDANIFMMGIGGTGVVTVNQILGTAALLDGRHVHGLDQTGLSQKGGPVVSHLKISAGPTELSNKIPAHGADCYLAFDILTAATAQSLAHGNPERTVAIVSTSRIPTGAMVRDTEVLFPETEGLRGAIDRASRADRNVYLDAVAMAEALFDDAMAANMILLGAAFQAGTIPVGADSIERAIALNGVSIEMNTHAFRAGRQAVLDREWALAQRPSRMGSVERAPQITPEARVLIDSTGADGELRRLLEYRVPELIAYQNLAHARNYVTFVKQVRAAERSATPDRAEFSQTVARYLFKLMAYKDEYEVARLHLASAIADDAAAKYPRGFELKYQLHPPLLRAMGFNRKLEFGRWFEKVFRVLYRMRPLRGTPLDIFGYARVRREERALIAEYRAMVQRMIGNLSPANYDRAVQIATLPDLIRGYEEIKLLNIERFRDQARRLMSQPDHPSDSDPAAGKTTPAETRPLVAAR